MGGAAEGLAAGRERIPESDRQKSRREARSWISGKSLKEK